MQGRWLSNNARLSVSRDATRIFISDRVCQITELRSDANLAVAEDVLVSCSGAL